MEQYGDKPPPHCAGHFSQKKFNEEFGDLLHGRALAVGFGDFICDEYGRYGDRLDKSRSDGQRRFVEVPLLSNVTIGGRSFRPPQVWCTGQVDSGIKPGQKGDSGGPRFVRARDGRWLFVGYTSGGNSNRECASSIFARLDLWREAADYYFAEVRRLFTLSTNSTTREEKQVRWVLDEFLANWSNPNDEALRRLKIFYYSEVTLNGMEVKLDNFYEEKTRFADQWPLRNFRVDSNYPMRES